MLKRDTGKLVFATIQDRGDRIQLFISKAVVGDDALRRREGARPRRLGRRARHGHDDTHRRAVGQGRPRPAAVEGGPAAARQVARTDRHRHALPAAVRRSDRQRGGAAPLPRSATRSSPASAERCTSEGFIEVETPVLHVEAGGAHARPFVHPPQRARHGPVPADRARAPPQAADRRRDGARVRDRPDLPQRGHLDPPQPRVHDDGAVPGVRRLERRDGHHRAADHPGRAGRDRDDRRSRSAARRSTSPSRGRGCRCAAPSPARSGATSIRRSRSTTSGRSPTSTAPSTRPSGDGGKRHRVAVRGAVRGRHHPADVRDRSSGRDLTARRGRPQRSARRPSGSRSSSTPASSATATPS